MRHGRLAWSKDNSWRVSKGRCEYRGIGEVGGSPRFRAFTEKWLHNIKDLLNPSILRIGSHAIQGQQGLKFHFFPEMGL
jgi:hypothetical protein